MARRTIFVSDLSGAEITNERDAVQIIVKFGDARKGQIVVDASPDDDVVKTLTEKGKQQVRRGRKPKAATVG